MTYAQKRNMEIVELLNRGGPVREISHQFHVSDGLIWQIKKEARRAAERAEQGRALREQICTANNIDRQWPIDAVVAALQIDDVRAHKGFERILRETGRNQVSLREMMDLLLLEPQGWMDSPIMFLPSLAEGRNIGWTTCLRLLAAPGRIDLGSAVNSEWKKRCKKAGEWLQRHHETGSLCCFLNCGVLPKNFD